MESGLKKMVEVKCLGNRKVWCTSTNRTSVAIPPQGCPPCCREEQCSIPLHSTKRLLTLAPHSFIEPPTVGSPQEHSSRDPGLLHEKQGMGMCLGWGWGRALRREAFGGLLAPPHILNHQGHVSTGLYGTLRSPAVAAHTEGPRSPPFSVTVEPPNGTDRCSL